MFAPRPVTSAIVLAALLGACTRGGPSGGADVAGSLKITDFSTMRSAQVGEGILAPNRIVVSSQGSLLYVATGLGEAYPEGYLHALDATTLAQVGAPLEVGRNISDMIAMGQQLLIASRAEGTLALVDPVSWQQLGQRLKLGFSPISLAALPGGEAAVVGADASGLVIVGEHNGDLAIVRRTSTPAISYDVEASEDGRTIYVASPVAGILAYDSATLRQQGSPVLQNRDLRAVIAWNGYVVTVSRDAYLYFINPATDAVTTIDVAADLGLSRATLPARGIDCNDLVNLGNGRLAVVNTRQHSLLYRLDPSGPTAVAAGLMPTGAFGTFVAAQDRLLITSPANNVVESVAVSAPVSASGALPATPAVLGVSIAAVQLIGGAAPAVAALDSLGSVHIVGQTSAGDRVLKPPPGAAWNGPFFATADGTIGVIENAAHQTIVMLNRDGQRIAQYGVTVPSVFSLASGGGEIAVTSRLNHQIEFIDTATGSSQIVVLSHDRPRVSTYTGGGDWLVFHDTNPNIGLTLVHDHTEVDFSPLQDWVIGALANAPDAAVAAAFDGTLFTVSATGSVTHARNNAGLRGLTDVEYGTGNDVWVTSANLGAAFHADRTSLFPDLRYSRYGLLAVGALGSTSSYGIATTRVLEIATPQ